MATDNFSFSPLRDKADYDIFVSYSRKDKVFVRALHTKLVNAGQDVWVDWEDIPPLSEWRQEIDLGIEAANSFVFVVSPNSVKSEVCREELSHAIQCGKRLVPIVWQDVDNTLVHPELAKLNYIFFRATDEADSALRALLQAISTDLNYVRSHTRLLVRAKEWTSRDRDSSLLLRGSYLEEAEQWLAQSFTKDPRPTDLHREYITASRRAETEREAVEIRLHRLTPQQYRNRQALINKVNHYWVQGVLENALRSWTTLELDLEERPSAVANTLNQRLELPDELPKQVSQSTQLIANFNQMGEGRTLLILGEPGAGKTTTLLKLTRDLIARAEQNLDQPIPVVFNLSSWLGEKQPIAHWLAEELNSKYQVPKSIGETWVQQQQLLPLLDGLDEVRAESREACVTGLNQFNQKYGSEMVVCSRAKDYESLNNRLNFQSAVYLRSLTSDQILHYLQNGGDKLAAVKTLIEGDPALQELARSPLMLNVMVMAYQGVSTEDIPKTDVVEERRQQLFNAYIDRMFKRRGVEQPYSREQTTHWLIWLAQHMAQFSQTVFLIEGMQPDWLPTKGQQRNYRIGVKLLLLMIWGGLHVGLIAGHQSNKLGFNAQHGLEGLALGLVGAVIYGVIGGLLGGLVNETTPRLNGQLINGLLLGVIYGSIFGWLYQDWRGGLAYGLIYGVLGVIVYEPIHADRDIQTVDTLEWSWRKARNNSVFGLAIALALYFGTPTKLASSLVFGLMASLIFGLEKRKEVDKSTVPNQGFWKSVANSRKSFLTIGLLTGILLSLIEGLASGFVNGLIFGMGSALIGGQGSGIVCIKHFTLRCLLWQSGVTPWNYARFLDYAADRIFLQKVGGGYVFIHRLLLEHFAQMQKGS